MKTKTKTILILLGIMVLLTAVSAFGYNGIRDRNSQILISRLEPLYSEILNEYSENIKLKSIDYNGAYTIRFKLNSNCIDKNEAMKVMNEIYDKIDRYSIENKEYELAHEDVYIEFIYDDETYEYSKKAS